MQAESVYTILPIFKSVPYKSMDNGDKQVTSGSEVAANVPKKSQVQPDIPIISPAKSVSYKLTPLLK